MPALVGGLIGGNTPIRATRLSRRDIRTITTAAVGRATGRPDEVDLQFAATAVEPDPADARRAVAERASLLREVLDDLGVPAEQCRTDGFRVRQPPPEPGPQSANTADAQPYHATETVRVTLFDFDLLTGALTGAVDRAGVEIRDVTFTFRTATQRELQREAVADAVEAAREKAVAAAATEGLSVGGTRSIVTDESRRPRQSRAAPARDTAESGSVTSGPLDVQARAEVEYELVEG